jgi:hypothetical protein
MASLIFILPVSRMPGTQCSVANKVAGMRRGG